MREKIVAIKITKKLFCYKEVKALSHTKNSKITADCPFGLKEYQVELCKYCVGNGETKISEEIVGELKDTK